MLTFMRWDDVEILTPDQRQIRIAKDKKQVKSDLMTLIDLVKQ